MIYNVSGNAINAAYDTSGNQLSQAYDLNGNPLMSSTPYGEFVVMTFNVEQWGGMNANSSNILSIFNSNSPIVVGLQEANTNGGFVPSPFQYESTGSPGLLKVMTTVPFTNYSAIRFDSSRYCEKFQINLGGRSVTVLNTHISILGHAGHFPDLSAMLSLMAQEQTFIALGDFNIETHDKTSQEYTDFIKPLIDAGYNLANWSDETGFVDTWFNKSTIAGSNYKCPCDCVITSSDIDIVDIIYDSSKIISGSTDPIDHLPVIATLQFHDELEAST